MAHGICLLLFGLLLSGCGSGEVRGRIAGKVTFHGKPVSEGNVFFSDDDKGIHMAAQLKPDGGYEIFTAKGAGLPVGTYRVAVCPPPVQPSGVFDATKMKLYPNIPQRYRDPTTSGLTLTVKEGDNSLDIAMKQ